GDWRGRRRETPCLPSSRRRAARYCSCLAASLPSQIGDQRCGTRLRRTGSACPLLSSPPRWRGRAWRRATSTHATAPPPARLTADPRVVPGARTVASLSYAEAAELAYFGAKVLHPKTIQPAMDRDIPVRICNSRAPRDPGTVVTAEGEVRPGGVKAIAHKCGV